MPEFNALLCLHSLEMLEQAVRHRNQLAALYMERLGTLPGIGFQQIRSGNRSSYKDFSITVDAEAYSLSRDQLAVALALRTSIHGSITTHLCIGRRPIVSLRRQRSSCPYEFARGS